MKSLKVSTLIVGLTLSIVASPRTALAASPFKKVSSGILHVPSGVIFPPRVGAFRFITTKLYGSAGRDAGAGYNVGSAIRGDVYVYPLGTYAKDFNGELRVQQSAIKQANQAVKIVSQGRFQMNQGGRAISGMLVQYELTRSLWGEKSHRCGSQLYLFRDGPWLIQGRFSYPIEHGGTAEKQIGEFFRLWQWQAQGNVVQLKRSTSDGSRG
ncbi:MAG TPA: hypothetical protein VH188_06360 [Chthoniobacterales bacterium]|nr:hypothetical protein [Chthoniobacterales bacterium]